MHDETFDSSWSSDDQGIDEQPKEQMNISPMKRVDKKQPIEEVQKQQIEKVQKQQIEEV